MLAYVDTSVWITSSEGMRDYRKKVDVQLEWLKKNGWRFCISHAVILEVLCKPHRENNFELINKYYRLFSSMKILHGYSKLLEDSIRVMQTENLKAMDAIHVALAKHHGCDGFVTTDPHFRNLTRISPIWIELAAV